MANQMNPISIHRELSAYYLNQRAKVTRIIDPSVIQVAAPVSGVPKLVAITVDHAFGVTVEKPARFRQRPKSHIFFLPHASSGISVQEDHQRHCSSAVVRRRNI